MAKLGEARPVAFLSTHPDPAYRRQTLSALVPEMRGLVRGGTFTHHPVDILY